MTRECTDRPREKNGNLMCGPHIAVLRCRRESPHPCACPRPAFLNESPVAVAATAASPAALPLSPHSSRWQVADARAGGRVGRSDGGMN